MRYLINSNGHRKECLSGTEGVGGGSTPCIVIVDLGWNVIEKVNASKSIHFGNKLITQQTGSSERRGGRILPTPCFPSVVHQRRFPTAMYIAIIYYKSRCTVHGTNEEFLYFPIYAYMLGFYSRTF